MPVPIAIGVVAIAALTAAGIAWWLTYGEETPEASAQEVVGGACAQIEAAESYDFTATITESNLDGSYPLTYNYYLEVQGGDYYKKTSYPDGSGVAEAMLVGGGSFHRNPGTQMSEWKRASFDFHDVTTAFAGLGADPLCPDASRFRSLGQTRDASGTYRTYTDMPVNPTPFPTTPATAVVPITRHATGHEISVNRQGQLHRLQMTIQDYMVSRRGVEINSRIVIDGRFSEIGIPNTITAPVVGGQ